MFNTSIWNRNKLITIYLPSPLQVLEGTIKTENVNDSIMNQSEQKKLSWICSYVNDSTQ